MRVRPVTANLKSKRVAVKKIVSEIAAKNAALRANMEQIEKEMQTDMELTQAAMSKAGEPIESGGLYTGIEDVASNVTYTTGDYKKIGKRNSMEGRLTLQEYEAISQSQDRRSEIGFKMDNIEAGGQEMMAILEKDGRMEE